MIRKIASRAGRRPSEILSIHNEWFALAFDALMVSVESHDLHETITKSKPDMKTLDLVGLNR
jgi:hypothetical protein